MLLITVSIGCGSMDPVTGRESLGYIPARFYDFFDILEFNLGIDSQFSLYVVVAVEPLAVGGGIYEGKKCGLDGRLIGYWSETRAEIDLAVESFIRYKKEPHWGTRYLFNDAYCPHKNVLTGDEMFYERWGMSPRILDHERRILDITAEVHLIAFGIDVGISLVEFLDFAVGILGIDVICDDDWVDPQPKRQVPLFEEDESEESNDSTEGS
jgi:hypothetical protein